MTRLELYRARSLRRNQRFRWRLRAGNGRIIATSGEGYANVEDARQMGLSVISGTFASVEVRTTDIA